MHRIFLPLLLLLAFLVPMHGVTSALNIKISCVVTSPIDIQWSGETDDTHLQRFWVLNSCALNTIYLSTANTAVTYSDTNLILKDDGVVNATGTATAGTKLATGTGFIVTNLSTLIPIDLGLAAPAQGGAVKWLHDVAANHNTLPDTYTVVAATGAAPVAATWVDPTLTPNGYTFPVPAAGSSVNVAGASGLAKTASLTINLALVTPKTISTTVYSGSMPFTLTATLH